MRAAPTPARAVMASRVQRVASLLARHRDIVPGGVRTTPSSSSSSSIQRLLRRATSSSSSSSASSPDASTAPTSAPATHVITAYELSATPPLAVTPLSLAGDARESASRASDGGDLWRRARLAREVRRGDGDDALALALAGEPLGAPRVELFVRGAGGVVYRHGEPGAATAAMTESLGDGILASGASRPLAATGDAADPDAYWSLLREALYAHALAVFGREFEVSRRGLRAVTLTSREGTARTTTATDGGNRAAQRFELTIAPGGIGAASVVVSPGRELRSARTIREILDDPNVPDPPAGTPVAAAGGPALEGALQYEVSGERAGTAGEPRPELGGASLLEYHRERYPARVPLLERADADAAAVWLVPRGPRARAMAYPAELLSPSARGGNEARSILPHWSPYDRFRVVNADP